MKIRVKKSGELKAVSAPGRWTNLPGPVRQFVFRLVLLLIAQFYRLANSSQQFGGASLPTDCVNGELSNPNSKQHYSLPGPFDLIQLDPTRTHSIWNHSTWTHSDLYQPDPFYLDPFHSDLFLSDLFHSSHPYSHRLSGDFLLTQFYCAKIKITPNRPISSFVTNVPFNS